MHMYSIAYSSEIYTTINQYIFMFYLHSNIPPYLQHILSPFPLYFRLNFPLFYCVFSGSLYG